MKIANIYKIYSNNGNKIYIGSTTQDIIKRINKHKSCHNIRLCSSSILFDEYGIENCKVELIKQCIIESRREQMIIEREEITKNENCVNKYKPIRTSDEKRIYVKSYNDKNKEKRTEAMKIWYQNNKEDVSEKNKQKYLSNIEENRKLYREYYEKNKEIRNDRARQKWNENKERVNKQRREKYALKKEMCSIVK